MTLKNFNDAMSIIAKHHSTKVDINKPENHFVGNLGTSYFTITIFDCCPAVITELYANDFVLTMRDGGLQVSKYDGSKIF